MTLRELTAAITDKIKSSETDQEAWALRSVLDYLDTAAYHQARLIEKGGDWDERVCQDTKRTIDAKIEKAVARMEKWERFKARLDEEKGVAAYTSKASATTSKARRERNMGKARCHTCDDPLTGSTRGGAPPDLCDPCQKQYLATGGE